jgi:cell division protein ZapA
MAILSIKIRIGDKDYPMKVDEKEEETLRAAGRLLNEKLKTFKEQYHIDDRYDLLVMVAFDSVVQRLKNQLESSSADNEIEDRISYLNSIISKSFTE